MATTLEEGQVFESILFPEGAVLADPVRDDTLHDLALDALLARLGGAPRVFRALRTPLRDVATVSYRQDVFRALRSPVLRQLVRDFMAGLQTSVQDDNAAKEAGYPYEAELDHLRGVLAYVAAVDDLGSGLDSGRQDNGEFRGWAGLARHVAALRVSAGFAELRAATARVRAGIADVRYNLLVRGPKVSVGPVDDEPDLSARIVASFERFQGSDEAEHCRKPAELGLEHVQGWILELVAKVAPEPFAALVELARQTPGYRDPVLEDFASDMHFYDAWLDCLDPLEAAGLPVCFPEVTGGRGEFAVQDGWDIALAERLVASDRPVVTNDLRLDPPEQILVISGPNQGGKTTTARMFGQLHHLAAIGCPVPGRRARIMLSDRVLTLFDREESLDDPQGRLGAELRRVRDVLTAITDHSVVVMNEAFSSTALTDAEALTREVLVRIEGSGALAACVTFIDELSRLDETTVSMVSSVDPSDPSIRTHRVVRRRADGRAYAWALARKHGLTLDQVRTRLGRSQAGEEPTGMPA